jgi:hypothetical protein
MQNFLVLIFYYTFCSTCFGCNTHPSSGAIYNVHADCRGKCTCELTCSTTCLDSKTSWNRSTHTCNYLYHLHVHYISLLRMDVYYIRNMQSKKCNKKLTLKILHQAGLSKPIYDDAWKYKNQIRNLLLNVMWRHEVWQALTVVAEERIFFLFSVDEESVHLSENLMTSYNTTRCHSPIDNHY